MRKGCSCPLWVVFITALCLGGGGHSGGSDDGNGNNGGSGDVRGHIAEVGQCDGNM